MQRQFSIKRYFLFLVLVLALFVSGTVESQDGLQYLAVARNIYYKGEPTAPVYEYGAEGGWKNIHMSTYVGNDGKTYSPTGLGYSLAMLPAVLVTDIFYKIYNIPPPKKFPLESDWLIQLSSSFTNIFFGAGIGVLLYLYLRELKVSHRNSLIVSFLTVFTTNIFALSKHILPHVMFIFFLFLSVYLIKKFFRDGRKLNLFGSGLAFGTVILTYNSTFLLVIPFLIIFYFLHLKKKIDKRFFTYNSRNFFIFLCGLIPLIFVYLRFEQLRVAPTTVNLGAIANYYSDRFLVDLPFSVFLEGFFGQLLSGRSVFLYSPLLLIPLFFWHKIDKNIKAEVVSFSILFVCYVCFYSTIFSTGRPEDQGVEGFWHGESSWGPRYLSPLIPFGMIVTGYILEKIRSKKQIIFFSFLAAVGFFVEILGVVMPYQIKFHELEKRFFINGTQYTMYVYSSFLPRYNPVFMMSKKLIKLIESFPKTLDTGEYNVRFIDGIDFAFNVGSERWRPVEEKGRILFDTKKEIVNKISLDLINHPVATTSATANVRFYSNNNKLTSQSLSINERKTVELQFTEILQEKNNELRLSVEYDNPIVTKDKSQILGLISMKINDVPVNIESIDVPYVSGFGPKMLPIKYKFWGEVNKDPWKFWEIHTQVFERTPDFWWIKPIYYWDMPKTSLFAIFVLNLLLALYFGLKLFKKTT